LLDAVLYRMIGMKQLEKVLKEEERRKKLA
jgi:hypothetical protein